MKSKYHKKLIIWSIAFIVTLGFTTIISNYIGISSDPPGIGKAISLVRYI